MSDAGEQIANAAAIILSTQTAQTVLRPTRLTPDNTVRRSRKKESIRPSLVFITFLPDLPDRLCFLDDSSDRFTLFHTSNIIPAAAFMQYPLWLAGSSNCLFVRIRAELQDTAYFGITATATKRPLTPEYQSNLKKT